MSMNLFLKAFTQEDVNAMEQDHELIDEWVWDEGDEENARYLLETDLETAWDVLGHLLDGVGSEFSSSVDFALSNGCNFVYTDLVKQQAEKLSRYSREDVLQRLQNLDPEADLYHQQAWQEEPEWLLEQFDKLVKFYQEAADKNLAVIFYAA
jgi:hypothetical protein